MKSFFYILLLFKLDETIPHAPAAASSEAAPAASTEAAASTEVAEPAAEEGKVFNIYCWNEEFKSRLTDHYPGYEEVDGTTGKIGDITVKWNITPYIVKCFFL